MKLLPLLFAPTVLFLATSDARISDELRFAVEAKTSLKKTFETSMKATSSKMRTTMNGKELPSELFDGFGLTIEEHEKIVVEDEYRAMGKGRPVKLARTFVELGGREITRTTKPKIAGGEDDLKTEDKTSELEGKTVVFTWDDKEEKYTRAYDDGKGEERLLEKLDEDMDLRVFLPDKSVSEGDEWEIDAIVFTRALSPGGSVGFEKNGDASEKISENATGTVKAAYKGTREVDGEKLGVVAIEAEITSHADPDEGAEEENGPGMQVKMHIKGELLWDLHAGHVHAFDATGTIELSMTQSQKVKAQDGDVELVTLIDLDGEMELHASISK